jgi:hypothetical protein
MTDDSGQWTVDSGQWTVDSGQILEVQGEELIGKGYICTIPLLTRGGDRLKKSRSDFFQTGVVTGAGNVWRAA